MKKIFLLIFVAFGVWQVSKSQCTQPTPAQVSLGANINGLADWNADRPFNDVFKMNRGMSKNTNAPWNDIAPLKDANGWPLEDFGVIVMADMDSSMFGTYKIKFNGQANITPVASGFTVTNKIYNSVTNATTANLVFGNYNGNNGQMIIAFTNTLFGPGVGGIKNIRIMQPGVAFNAPTFSQRFLNHMSRFSVLRFMDWHSTNGNIDSLWVNRTKKTSTTQTGSRGVAWEYCVELANTLNKDLWINIPHKANNYYIRSLSNLIKNSLNPNLNVYVEYSNEVWNWSFEQSGWNLNQSIIDANKPGSPLNYDNVNDQYTWCQRRIGLQAKTISDIFKSTWGAAAINNRVRVVYGVQYGWYDFTRKGIEFIDDYYGSPSNYFYAIAIAPYFNTAGIDTSNNATKQQVLTAMLNDVTNTFDAYENSVDVWAAFSHFYNIKLFCYEGGPDTFGPNNIQAKKEASRDNQMKIICEDYLTKWYTYGADGLFNWFTAGAGNWNTPYGTWSLTENYENSAKLQAINNILATTPVAISAGQNISVDVDARKVAGYQSNFNNNPDLNASTWMPYHQYLIRVPNGQAGDYSLQANTRCNAANQQMRLLIDNIDYGIINIPNNNGTGYATTAAVNIPNLGEGLHGMRFMPVTSGYYVRDFVFTNVGPCNAKLSKSETAAEEISIYPNPAFDIINVKNNGINVFSKIVITDNVGHEIIITPYETSINIKRLDKGIYFIKILDTNNVIVYNGKFVKN